MIRISKLQLISFYLNRPCFPPPHYQRAYLLSLLVICTFFWSRRMSKCFTIMMYMAWPYTFLFCFSFGKEFYVNPKKESTISEIRVVLVVQTVGYLIQYTCGFGKSLWKGVCTLFIIMWLICHPIGFWQGGYLLPILSRVLKRTSPIAYANT